MPEAYLGEAKNNFTKQPPFTVASGARVPIACSLAYTLHMRGAAAADQRQCEGSIRDVRYSTVAKRVHLLTVHVHRE